jgi:hypothetical protein
MGFCLIFLFSRCNKYIVFWPGGKPKSDSIINSVGDTFGAIIGWLSAYYLDKKW